MAFWAMVHTTAHYVNFVRKFRFFSVEWWAHKSILVVCEHLWTYAIILVPPNAPVLIELSLEHGKHSWVWLLVWWSWSDLSQSSGPSLLFSSITHKPVASQDTLCFWSWLSCVLSLPASYSLSKLPLNHVGTQPLITAFVVNALRHSGTPTISHSSLCSLSTPMPRAASFEILRTQITHLPSPSILLTIVSVTKAGDLSFGLGSYTLGNACIEKSGLGGRPDWKVY